MRVGGLGPSYRAERRSPRLPVWSGAMMSCLAERGDGDSRRRLPGLTWCGHVLAVQFRLAAPRSCRDRISSLDPSMLPGGSR